MNNCPPHNAKSEVLTVALQELNGAETNGPLIREDCHLSQTLWHWAEANVRYVTRHPTGLEVFRDCQIKALNEQSKTRATVKVTNVAASSGQGEFFESRHDMGPDELKKFLENEVALAEKTLLELTPKQPGSIKYEKLWPQVLARHVVRKPDVNKIGANLRKKRSVALPRLGKRQADPTVRL